MFLRNQWYVGAMSDEIGDRPLARTLLDEPVVFFRDSSGAAIALEDRCVHRQAPLSLGDVVGDTLQCAYHGLCFDRAGACVRVPSQKKIPPGARVKSYPVAERYGFVFLWLGDAGLADATVPYKFGWDDSDAFRMMHTRLQAKFDYRLLIDNLMDVTHLPFAHKSTIGTAAIADNFTARTERLEDGVRISRWMENIDQAPTHIEVTGYDGKVDRWQIITYTPPGFVWLQVGSARVGTGGRDATGDDLLIDRNTVHSLTPETENSAHYFWITSHKAGAMTAEQEQTIYDRSIEAFHEDLVIIEGQATRLDATIPTIDVTADAAAIAARQLLARLIDAEAKQGLSVAS
jgi:vanillate O-demethylase monooxygenase subunit